MPYKFGGYEDEYHRQGRFLFNGHLPVENRFHASSHMEHPQEFIRQEHVGRSLMRHVPPSPPSYPPPSLPHHTRRLYYHPPMYSEPFSRSEMDHQDGYVRGANTFTPSGNPQRR